MITWASYRDEELFARPICNLASQFLSANSRPGPNTAGASESTLRMLLDKKTLHCVVINIPFLTRSAVGSHQTDRQGIGSMWKCAERCRAKKLETPTQRET